MKIHFFMFVVPHYTSAQYQLPIQNTDMQVQQAICSMQHSKSTPQKNIKEATKTTICYTKSSSYPPKQWQTKTMKASVAPKITTAKIF